jgi:hypothetical protein
MQATTIHSNLLRDGVTLKLASRSQTPTQLSPLTWPSESKNQYMITIRRSKQS